MNWAYVDSSFIIACLFNDHSKNKLKPLWRSADRFISSYLLEAEVLSAVYRENSDLKFAKLELQKLSFVKTDSLLPQLQEIYKSSYLRGADAFHLATALWIRGKHAELQFITLDEDQKNAALKLGF